MVCNINQMCGIKDNGSIFHSWYVILKIEVLAATRFRGYIGKRVLFFIYCNVYQIEMMMIYTTHLCGIQVLGVFGFSADIFKNFFNIAFCGVQSYYCDNNANDI